MIDIQLDHDAVTLGNTVRGRVSFTPSKEVKPRKIQVFLGWRTEGRGSTAKDTLVTGTHESGPVSAGETVTVPFEFRIPDDVPVSFDGRLIRMIWEIGVQVDLPWAFDEKSAAVFTVAAPVVAP
jgi:hypothetical protein